MSYVAAVCGKGAEVNQVKEQLLQSNPVLEGKNLTEYVPAYYLCVHWCSSWAGLDNSDVSLLFGVQNHRRCFMWIHLLDFLQWCVGFLFFFWEEDGFPHEGRAQEVRSYFPASSCCSQRGLHFLNPALMMLVCIKRLDFSPSDSFPSKSYYYSL